MAHGDRPAQLQALEILTALLGMSTRKEAAKRPVTGRIARQR